ncbi:MAG: hypothetical protein M0026_04285 [Nocardiopsaceae bacterium]|nr:hypothetical protein [Nocardiopsaceae bacterium]
MFVISRRVAERNDGIEIGGLGHDRLESVASSAQMDMRDGRGVAVPLKFLG